MFHSSAFHRPRVIHAVLIHELEYICSAVIITDKHALVAAGYVENLGESPQNLSIKIAVREFPVPIIRIKLHPHFNPTMTYGDIAILTVSGYTQNSDLKLQLAVSCHPMQKF